MTERIESATNKFTNMDAAKLKDSMAKFEGMGIVATVNEDGSPNAAIFMPAMPDEEHLVLVLAKNNSRANIERTGKAHLVYDVPNPKAEEKAARHAGARLELRLLRPEGETAAEYQQIAESYPRMNPATLIFRIENIFPIG